MSNLVGRTLGPYKLEAPLGKGGMAMVFRAFQTSVKRYVAIKVMAPEIASEAGFVERFGREAEVIAQLEHPHILPVIDYGEADGLHYIVMRFMDGGSLDDRIRDKQLSFEEISRYLTQIASALDYAHRRGVIHRDLKPNNVLLDSEDNVYLTDFGIARLAGSERKLTATGSVMGTPAYMAPEQAMGRPVDGRSDIYSLGIMLYEMVTRQLPFSADTPAALIFQHVYEQPKPASTFRSDLPPAVMAVLDRAMAKSPDVRYQTGSDMAHEFAEAVGLRSNTPRTASQASSAQSMDERTMAVRQTPAANVPRLTAASGNERTIVDNGTLGRAPGGNMTSAAGATQYSEPTTAAPQQKRSNTGMIIGIVVVLLLAAAGGAFALITNTNNTNATATGVAIAAGQTLDANTAATNTAIANATNTQMAIIISSYTPTSTFTPTLTETPTATFTFTPSNTPTFTDTPDAPATALAFAATQTQEALFGQATSVRATLDTFQTKEAITNITATAQVEATSAARATGTSRSATFEAGRVATLSAQGTAIVLTAMAPTPIPPTPIPPTFTRVPPTPVPPTPAPPTAVASGDVLDGLLTDDGATIISTLRTAGSLPRRARLLKVGIPTARQSNTYSGNSTESRVFYSFPLVATRFSNFVLSTTISLNTSTDGAARTYCGIFYHGVATDGSTLQSWTPKDLSAVAFDRAGDYGVYVSRDSTIESNPVVEGTSEAIEGGKNAENRLTVVQIDGQLTAYINGVEVVNTRNDAFTSGQIGFFFFKGVTGDTETCSSANVQLWRVLG
ncbi:MAG: serine/threonine protein kinase [Anaerolineae bacterium]|nr:serine/threonine protein kinase [Anaerolineae bacterium]